MAAPKIRLDSAGIAEVLRRPAVANLVDDMASAVSANVGTPTASGRPLPVHRRSRTASGGRLSARPAVDVTIADPAGLAVEAKRGYLVKAAASAGLEVKKKG
jgi:hypothetical protein